MPDKESPSVNEVISFGPYSLRPSERLLEKDGVALQLGGRALGILIALIERAGEVVCKEDLVARVWPDVTVGEGSLRFHVTGLRKALGDGHAGSRFIINVPGRGYCFVAPVSRSSEPRRITPPPQVGDRTNNLPARLVRMVGRDDVVHTITAQVLIQRFVSIVGPGGIGKTTVALAVADALLSTFESSVYFVDFSPLREPSLVASTLASVLGLSVQSDYPMRNIVSFLRDRQTLIVLDCCEHLIEATAILAEQLFAEAPLVHILATSRESLRVEGEHVFRLFPLESPPDGMGMTAAEAVKYPAVQLFVERAAAVLYQFELLDADAPVVAEICRRLDGIALAIELAAGRVDAYGISGIKGLLDDRFRLLGQVRRTALPRHQTLGATLDWSHGLLPESERIVLRRLSVFVGTFTLEAAQAVAAADDVGAAQAVDAVVNLVTKSLATADVRGPTARYRLLDTTRVYALQKLADSEGVRPCARRHAEYFCRLLQQAEAQAAAGATSGEFAACAQDSPNVRAALEWAFSSDGDATVGVALAAVASTQFLELSLLTESRGWAEKAVARPEPIARGTREEMLLQMCLGVSIMYTIGNNDEAYRALKRALGLAEKLDDPYYQLHTLETLGNFYQRTADMRGVRAIAIRGESVIKVLASRTGHVHTNWMMASSYQLTGDQANARKSAEVAIRNTSPARRVRRFAVDRRNNAMITLARALWMQGYPEQAIAAARDVLAEARSVNHSIMLCIALHWMTSVSIWSGALAMADELIAALIDRADKFALPSFHARALGWNGTLSLQRGNTDDAIRLLRSSLESLDAVRDQQMKTAFHSELAEALALAGHRDESLVEIDEVIARIGRTGEGMFLPEALRRKGDILTLGTVSDATIADECFKQSIAHARRQGALSWELRTATSFARLRHRQGRRDEARAILAPVYSRFSEGFGTADLRAARHLLDEHP